MDEKKETQGGLVVNASELRESDLIFWAQQTNPDLQEQISAFYLSPPSPVPCGGTETKAPSYPCAAEQEVIKYVCAVVMFAITLYFSIGFIGLLLNGLDLQGDGNACIVVSFILASIVFASTSLFWKKSAVVRNTSITIPCLVAILAAVVICLTDTLLMFPVAFIVGILLLVGALPWKTATVGQCILLLQKILGAYVPLVLSGILAAALHLFTRHSNSDIVNLSPLFLLLIGLCLTLYLLCRVAVKLSRFFSSTASKVVPMLLFFVGSILTLFMLFITVFLFLILFAIEVAHRHHQPFASPALESAVPIVDVPEPLESDIQIEPISHPPD